MDDRIEELEEQLVEVHALVQRLEEKISGVEEQEDIVSAKFVCRPIFVEHFGLTLGLLGTKKYQGFCQE